MNHSRLYSSFALFSFLLLSFVLAFHFHIGWLPLACLLLGSAARLLFPSRHLEIFSFLIPILPFCAAFENKGFPLNYLLLPLFFLAGIVAAELAANRGRFSPPLPSLPSFYPLYLLLLGASFFFVVLRWSNLTLSPLAFFKDTPVAPTGQRLSFAIIFPVVELALFVLSPLYFLLLKRVADRRRILTAFLGGQSLSILVSLFQRWQGKNVITLPLGGLASDSTAFGFLSTVAIVLAGYLFIGAEKKWPGLLFIFISLIGILNSMTRVGFIAILFVFVLIAFSSKRKMLPLLMTGIMLTASFILYSHFFHRQGFNFISRLKNSLTIMEKTIQHETLGFDAWNNLSSGRDVLWRYNWRCLKDYPAAGVGCGNFVFWVMHTFPGNFMHHLSANQYFFIASSTGLIGLLVFMLFCFGIFRQKKGPEKWLWAALLFLLVFNDYLWFPEIFLVFWLFASLGESHEIQPQVVNRWQRILFSGIFLLFVFFNLASVSRLHPKNWTRGSSTPYAYGFSYPENEGERSFRWSGGGAGIYVFLEKGNPQAQYLLSCGAPLSQLPGQKQVVDVFWRGKRLQQLVFRKNGDAPLRLADRVHDEGFLEFRVVPTFNLNKMGLGEESRDLGIQVRGPGI